MRMASGPYVHDVYVADASTGKVLRRLTATDNATSPAWSPDGNRLAVVFQGTIVVGVAGRRGRAIGSGRAPAWSPDGKRFVFVDAAGLELVGANGDREKLLLRCTCASPDWQAVR